jgi:acyl dehydratase
LTVFRSVAQSPIHDSREELSVPLVLENPNSLTEWVGRKIGVTDWLTITQHRIQQFAEVTDDRQWIHVDQERARRDSPFQTTIAHGFLTLSLLSRFIRQVVEIRSGVRMTVNYGLNRVRFPAPVRADSRIRVHFVVQSAKQVPGALEAVFEVSVETEGSPKPCCVAEWVLRYYF